MYNTQSLKYYLHTNYEKFIFLTEEIYQIFKKISKDYPNNKKWYYEKQIKGVINNQRDILFITKNEKIIAVACLKKDEFEKKICTLYVEETYRNQKIGSHLVEESMKLLETSTPFITISAKNIFLFTPLIKKYNWVIKEKVNGIYNSDETEICVNGYLTKNKNLKK